MLSLLSQHSCNHLRIYDRRRCCQDQETKSACSKFGPHMYLYDHCPFIVLPLEIFASLPVPGL